MRSVPGRLAVVLAGAGVAVLAMLVGAPPALAHGGGGGAATNWLSEVVSVRPAMAGVSVRLPDAGTVEVVSSSGRPVTVLGYDGEPYLRIAPSGVEENTLSPAAYLNRTSDGRTALPAGVDARAAPRWVRVAGGPAYRWHDHRTHWMSATLPPGVAAEPGARELVAEWTVGLRYGDVPVMVSGRLWWVPGPAVWPWGVLVLVLAGLGWLVAGLAAWRVWVVGLLGVLVGATVMHVVGARGAGSVGGVVLGLVPVVVAWGVAGAAAWAVVRQRPSAGWGVVLTGALLGVLAGLADVGELTHSQVAFAGPGWVARLCVAVAMGLGLGLVLCGWRLLRWEQRLPGARSAETVVGGVG